MNRNVMLTVASLLSILLMTFHLSGDIVFGMDAGRMPTMIGVLILVVWLYGTLALPERRSGYIIMLLGGIFAAGMPPIHLRGAGVGGAFAKSSGAFFFIWTLFAIGTIGAFAAILATRALWGQRRGRPQ